MTVRVIERSKQIQWVFSDPTKQFINPAPVPVDFSILGDIPGLRKNKVQIVQIKMWANSGLQNRFELWFYPTAAKTAFRDVGQKVFDPPFVIELDMLNNGRDPRSEILAPAEPRLELDVRPDFPFYYEDFNQKRTLHLQLKNRGGGPFPIIPATPTGFNAKLGFAIGVIS
jgi:hypothetical protein